MIKKTDPIYVKELKYYSKHELINKIGQETFSILFQKGIIKSNDKELYNFNYVGVLVINDTVINVYPKYIPQKENRLNIEKHFKLVIKVLKKYFKESDYLIYTDDENDNQSFNYISIMLFLLEDYYENGIYYQIKEEFKVNGYGEINWDKTINNTFALIQNNQPFYLNMITKDRQDNFYNFIRLLHEYVITECSEHLENLGLLNIFELTPIKLSDKVLSDFGDSSFIVNRLKKELNIEFNTHKKQILKNMIKYFTQMNYLNQKNKILLYGVLKYEHIWETICKNVLKNKLDKSLKELSLPKPLNEKYKDLTLIKVIEKPKWFYKNSTSESKSDKMKTLEPDLITFDLINKSFLIFDAKYYNLKINDKYIKNQPGIYSITKQYLYELAFKEFIDLHGFNKVKNAFLFPTYNSKIENLGHVDLNMLLDLDIGDNNHLAKIQLLSLPVSKMYHLYLENKKIENFTLLQLK